MFLKHLERKKAPAAIYIYIYMNLLCDLVMFQWSFSCVLVIAWLCFNVFLMILQGCFREVGREIVRDVLGMCQGCLGMFQECFRDVSDMCQGCFRYSLVIFQGCCKHMFIILLILLVFRLDILLMSLTSFCLYTRLSNNLFLIRL